MKKMNNVPHRRVRIMRPRKGLTVAQQLQAPLNQALLNRAYRAYGEAMESAQLLETSLALLLLGVFYERSDLENLEECAKLHGYLFKATVGRLILRLKRELPSTAPGKTPKTDKSSSSARYEHRLSHLGFTVQKRESRCRNNYSGNQR